jgi:hypothetical protein
MKIVGLLVTAVLVAACSAGGQPAGTTQPSAAAQPGASTAAGQTTAAATQAAGGTGSGSVLDNATAVKHFCDLLPTALVAGIVPDGGPPQEDQFPPRCSVYGSKTAMEIALDAVVPLGDTPAGAEAISGLGTGAYLEHLSPGNFYLSIGLSPDSGVLHVEIDIQDGKDHKDDVVDLAKAVLQKLGG